MGCSDVLGQLPCNNPAIDRFFEIGTCSKNFGVCLGLQKFELVFFFYILNLKRSRFILNLYVYRRAQVKASLHEKFAGLHQTHQNAVSRPSRNKPDFANNSITL